MRLLIGALITSYLLISLPSYCSGDKKYAVGSIPADVRKNADALIRENIYRFEIKSKTKAKLEVRTAVTIFKKNDEAYGSFYELYDDMHEIDDLEGTIFDSEGNVIRELESKDIEDYPAFSANTLYQDTRIKSAELYHNQYPYTIEFRYEISYNGYINFPKWYSRHTIDPVEHSRFEVVTFEKNLRYWCSKDTIKPFISKDGSNTVYTWDVKNQGRLSRDAIGEYIEDVAVLVIIAPSLFEILDYPGSMESWKDFGKWYQDLCENRDRLPDEAVNEIRSLCPEGTSIKDKIKILYSYFQKRTRYVSVQLGIGGWQPFDAGYVHQRGYGDCKALANYMRSILQQAGITAYPVLINSGKSRYPLITEFPSNQFNHVILCIPSESDTTWLECTNQSAPAGYIGAGNENRDALMITPEGGVIVRTPKSSSSINMQIRNASVVIKADGTAEVSSAAKYTGNNRAYVQNMLDDNSREEQYKWVLNSMENPECSIRLLKFESAEDKSSISLDFDFTLSRYANVSNNRIFFNPDIMERRTSVPNDVAKRVSPVIFYYPYKDVDTIIYKIPGGYKIESLPAPVNCSMPAGTYSSSVSQLNNGDILYQRSLEINNYILRAEDYSLYRKFYTDVVKSDRSMVVLVKTN